ncbi:MAG: dihydrofolate reductase [Trueperella sp.]|nr:dihydrofolate reductase [Trueperella sp.]
MLGMIWAQGHDRAIGRDGGMAWHVPEDFAFFKAATLGHPVIMGRKTWESFPAQFRPLPGRQNIVITRNSDYAAPGALVTDSFDTALELALQYARTEATPGSLSNSADPLVWLIGGAHFYNALIDQADGVVVTDIDLAVPEADAFAPAIPPDWELIATDPSRGWHTSRKGPQYRFSVYRPRGSKFPASVLPAATE